MALDRTTIWICDVCGAKETLISTDTKEGLDTPYTWDYITIYVSEKSTRDYVGEVLMCGKCLYGFRGLYSLKPESKEILKQPFWQKILGRPDEG